MNLEELGEDALKENIISTIAKMSKVDKMLHENELVYILHLGQSMGLSEESIRSAILNSDVEPYIPRSEEDRMTILYYLIFLIKVDGSISEREVEMMHYFALKLGFNQLMVDNIISVIRAHLHRRLPENAILEEVKKYLN